MQASGGGAAVGVAVPLSSEWGRESAWGLTCRGAGRGFVVQAEVLAGRCGAASWRGPALTFSTFSALRHQRQRQPFRQPQAACALKSSAVKLAFTGKHNCIIYAFADALPRVSCLLAQIQCATAASAVVASISLAPTPAILPVRLSTAKFDHELAHLNS